MKQNSMQRNRTAAVGSLELAGKGSCNASVAIVFAFYNLILLRVLFHTRSKHGSAKNKEEIDMK